MNVSNTRRRLLAAAVLLPWYGLLQAEAPRQGVEV